MAATMLRRAGTLLYLVEPNATTFQHKEEVPDYINEAVPLMVFLIVLEGVAKWILGHKEVYSSTIGSLTTGLMFECIRVLLSGVLFIGYEWLYQYRLIDLPWDALYTWLAAFLFVDFFYYCLHRAFHEVNILWAVHLPHHSSEDYNLAAGLRLSVFQRIINFSFSLPGALLGIPFPALLVHNSLNVVYQFWLHTEFVGKLGPLEWMINTPSLHRVHHGANNWCLDKNYGGLLMVWDLLFDTYQVEREDSEIVYGLTKQPQTHNAVYYQTYHFGEVFRKARSMSTWTDSLKAVFYGPGWTPGAPRLGDPTQFPAVTAPRKKYDPQPPLWRLLYVVTHLLVILLIQQLLLARFSAAPWMTSLIFSAFIFSSIGVVTSMLDGRRWTVPAEVIRCTFFIFYARSTLATHIPILDTVLVLFFTLCAIFWVCYTLARRHSLIKTDKLQ